MWDYLIVTASNEAQASAYQSQLQLRRKLGLLPQVSQALIVPDLDGKRIGSGGSTLHCLRQVLDRHRGEDLDAAAILRRLRILIVHAGGGGGRFGGGQRATATGKQQAEEADQQLSHVQTPVKSSRSIAPGW